MFELGLDVVVPPPSLTFTDEVGAPVTVFAFKNFGSGGKRGVSIFPVGDVPVTFTISSGNGTFTANNSTVFVTQTAPEGPPGQGRGGVQPGEAVGSPVLVGRTATPVTVNITSPGFPPTSAVYGTTPSTYSLQAVTPANPSVMIGQPLQITAQALRAGNSTPAPLGAGEVVTWSVTPPSGATVTQSTVTDANGNATTEFTAQTPGPDPVTAQFDPQISGVSPSTVNYSVQVNGQLVVRSLVPFSGDMTRGPAGFQFPISARYLEDGQPVVPAQPLTVLWQVVSGDATVSPATSQVGAPLGIAGTTVTFGSTPGQVVVSATLQEFTNVNTLFYLDLVENTVLEITDPVSQRLDLEPGADFGVSLRLRGESGVGLGDRLISIDSLIDDLPTELMTASDGSGSVAGTAPQVPGTYAIEFRFDGHSGQSSSKAVGVPPLSETVLVNVVQPQVGIARLIDTEGNGQRGLVNSPAAPLRVLYTENDQPVQGISIDWVVNSGGGTPATATTITNAQGIATLNYTFGPAPGPVSITASTGEVSAVFNLSAERAQLRIVSGNGQSGPIQTTADQPLVVELLDPAGVGIANRTIVWSVNSGGATLIGSGGNGTTVQSVTNAAGRAQIGFRFGNAPGAVAISASSDLASAPVLFAAQAQLPGLRLISGNNQSGEPGTRLAQDLVVSIAPELAKALGGVTINWEVVAGGGTVGSTTTTTDANGQSRNQLTLGAQPGTNQVRASIAGGTNVVFTAQAVAAQVVVSVVKVSGDNQLELPTNLDSAPLVVRVTRVSDGSPFPGATIVWNGSNAGFPVQGSPNLLSETTSLTNGAGEARIVARVIASGPATVTARLRDSIIDPLVFNLVGLIANTPTLNQNEVRVAEVLDSACIGLASLSSRTAAQEDLLTRCRELQRGSGPNPEEVSDALEELDPDVGLTMTTAGLEVITSQITNVNNYLIEARNNPGGRGQFRVALATRDGALPLSFLPSALIAGAEEESAEGQDLGPDFGRWGFFASGTIGRGKYREGQRIPDYDYNAGNLTAGVDYRLSDTVILGGALGFSRHDTELRNDRGNLDASGFNLIGFATWYNERQWFVDGVLSLGRNDYDLVRNINYRITSNTGGVTNINQVASSSTSGDQLGFSLSVGRDWQTGPWSISSYLRANYLRTDFDAYEEQTIANLPGSGLALGVAARSQQGDLRDEPRVGHPDAACAGRVGAQLR